MSLEINLSNKKALAGMIVLVCLIALAFYLPHIFSSLEPGECTINGVCQHEVYAEFLIELIPIFVVVGVVIGTGVFFFMSSKLESKNKDLERIIEALIKFLGKEERLVVEKLLENNGKILQAEISRIDGIGKLKSHRIVQRLVGRGVIEIEHYGKTNIIKLNKEIKEALVLKEN